MFAVKLTEHAQLRPLEPWQAEEFLAHIDRARATVDPWVPWASRSTDLESARGMLQRFADRHAADTGRLYGIWLDGTLVGTIMFVGFNVAAKVCELGCAVEPAGQGHGLATVAARQLIDWAFRERGMHRVEWRCRPENVASSGIARRLGMTLDGTLRQEFFYQGKYHDTEVWSLLSDEWSARAAG